MLWTLFSKNPFRSVKEHMNKTVVCVKKTRELFDAVFSGNKTQVQELAHQISVLEHECDLIKQEIRGALSKSVFLPVDRRDIIHVLSNMDTIADIAEDLGVLVTLRWMEMPKELELPFRDLLDRSCKVVFESAKVIDALERLFEAGFSGPDAEEVLQQIDAIDRAEHEADKAQDVFGKALFAHEDEMKPAQLFMWIKIANKIGDLANSAERMVGHVRLMLAQG